MAEKFYMTTAIAYTSGKPHIGNTYEFVLADAIARYKRSKGYDVFFQTGTDEHGQKIELKAEEAGVTPKEFVDGVAAQVKEIADLMNTSYDKFIRTTDEYHEKQVQKIFKKLYDQGDIYKGHYEGMYCTPCESFFTESQLVDGKCPDCGRPCVPAKEEAYFFKMSKYADRLIEHINTHPEFIQPESRKNEMMNNFLLPEMMNNFLLPGLQDLCVSRTSFKWGIPVDFDPKHVVYVWLDALTNYITGIGYDCDGESTEQFKKDWPADLHLIGKDIIRFHTIYWPIFLMALDLPLPKQIFGHPWLLQGDGKMSKSKGNVIYADELVKLFGVDAVRYFVLHEMPFDNDGVISWELMDGKMSKSKGNVIYADELVKLFGVDAVRYFVLHEMPFDNDGVISWELMVERLNSDLANTLGNLVNRTISMTNKYFGGSVADKGAAEAVDAELKAVVEAASGKVDEKMDKLRVADAITEIFNVFKRCNKYIDETMPWALAKEEEKKDRLETVLYNLIVSISEGAKLLASFMPETAEKILAQLNGGNVVEKPEILFARRDLAEVMEEVAKLHPAEEKEEEKAEDKILAQLNGGNVVEKPEILFARRDLAEVMEEVAKLHPAEEKEEEKAEDENVIDLEPKAEITFDDFEKLQFQVGEIIACEEVKKSKKLLCSQVKIGSQVRQIVSGIKAHYSAEEMVGKKVMVVTNLKPAKLAKKLLCSQVKIGSQVRQIVSGIKAHYSAEEMVGKKVMVVTNLKPAKLAGILSEGMILCAEDAEGNLSLMVPEKEMPAGAEIC